MPLTRRSTLAIAAACAAVIACGGRAPQSSEQGPRAVEVAPNPASDAAPDRSARPRIVCLGDSLTAGLGLAPEQAYPALLQQRIDAAGLRYEVTNAGVSGDTSAGGVSRVDWALSGDVRILVVALGGNDALRGLPTDELKRNLATIVEKAQARHIAVILAGMEAPPNFGESYTVSFHRVYPDLAARYHVPLIPFLLDGVAGVDGLNQADGIHPTPAGARIVADNVWRVLHPLLVKGAHAR